MNYLDRIEVYRRAIANLRRQILNDFEDDGTLTSSIEKAADGLSIAISALDHCALQRKMDVSSIESSFETKLDVG